MKDSERYEVNSKGELVTGIPVQLNPDERKSLIKELFSQNGWQYTLKEEYSPSHYLINLENPNTKEFLELHLYNASIRKEEKGRNLEEARIQLGTGNDPREYLGKAIILGFYVYEEKSLSDSIIVAWPVENEKNYPGNPSLRVNMRTDILEGKNIGYYVDEKTVKNLVVFRPEFIFYYIKSYQEIHYSNAPVFNINEDETSKNDEILETNLEKERKEGGSNIILYGVPGSGKSWTIEHEYCKENSKVERVVFHPDYTYSDFIGQILPNVEEKGQVTYKFTPGPFTKIMKEAYNNPKTRYILIIEEINRGNAPAIFGDVFQLLDRKTDTVNGNDYYYKPGTSEYAITNENIAEKMYGKERRYKKVRIPSNLTFIGTMNTSDQNVFTLDTAFQRRWDMCLIENKFSNVDSSFETATILDTTVTWGKFCEEINKLIVENNAGMASLEDKRLGVYFVHAEDLIFDEKEGDRKEYDSLCKKENEKKLTPQEDKKLLEIRDAMKHNRKFAEKVIKYLWDDAFKFDRSPLFEQNNDTLEKVLAYFTEMRENSRFDIFNESVRKEIINLAQ